MVKIISWNIAQRDEAWRRLLEVEADIALLQEATEPPPDVAEMLDVDPAPWLTAGGGQRRPWRVAVVKLSNRVAVQWMEPQSIENSGPGELAVSRLGTLAAATVTPTRDDPFIAVSLYAVWEGPHSVTGSGWIYADGSVHRLISDLSVLVGQQTGHRIIAAGDLNILYGYGENGSVYWAHRYATVFDRLSTLGLEFVGPQAPAGRQAEPWPDELPDTSCNVPTYYTNQQIPTTAKRQLDFVFASTSLSRSVKVRALNEPQRWGPSDHCRVEIELASGNDVGLRASFPKEP